MKRQAGKIRASRGSGRSSTPIQSRRLKLSLGPVRLPAEASIPEICRGWVVCASSEGVIKESELSAGVLDQLRNGGHATLEVDLLSKAEASDPLIRFDIPLLAERLIAATDWLRHSGLEGASRVAYLAGGNAAAAALWSSVQRGNHVAAVVSVCGRPHLAEPFIGDVTCPTLLLVEGQDARLLHMNQQAKRRLHCPSKLIAVTGNNARQRREGRRKLSLEAVQWIQSYLERDKPSNLFTSLVRSGFGTRLKRQLLAALAVSSFFLALPQSARTSAGGKADGKLKKEGDLARQPLPGDPAKR